MPQSLAAEDKTLGATRLERDDNAMYAVDINTEHEHSILFIICRRIKSERSLFDLKLNKIGL